MGKICEVCQKGAMSGHNVSHSNRKSNRVWLPNTQRVRVNVGGAVRHMNVCTRCLRSGKVEIAPHRLMGRFFAFIPAAAPSSIAAAPAKTSAA